MTEPGRIHAAWLYDGASEPRSNVVLEIHEGIITDVAQGSGPPAGVAIIPPIVNAHTHTELSDVEKPFTPGPSFPDWIARVMSHRRSRESSDRAVDRGVNEITHSGTVRFADIVAPGEDGSSHYPRPPTNLAHPFVEYIGLSDERTAAAIQHAETLGSETGISPHATYSVCIELVQNLCDLGATRNIPLTMHLAETAEEMRLLTDGTGPFAHMLQGMDLWQPGLFPRWSMLDYLDCLSRGPRIAIAHANYFGDRELRFLAERNQFSVVFCPRTHAHFGHPAHPWQRMRDLGITVSLGTDSRASNPDLEVWREAQFLHNQKVTAPRELLEMVTANGSVALRGSAESVSPGGAATFSVLACPPDATDFWGKVFDWQPTNACVNGNWLNPKG